MSKIKLVVFNEHTLGYILPKTPNTLCVLHASILRGAINSGSSHINSNDKVRLANEKDFEDYRIMFNGYKNNLQEYEYAQ